MCYVSIVFVLFIFLMNIVFCHIHFPTHIFYSDFSLMWMISDNRHIQRCLNYMCSTNERPNSGVLQLQLTFTTLFNIVHTYFRIKYGISQSVKIGSSAFTCKIVCLVISYIEDTLKLRHYHRRVGGSRSQEVVCYHTHQQLLHYTIFQLTC